MSDGFQVTMSDLLAASDKFRAEERDFGALMPSGGPSPVDGGSPAVNGALSQVLESIGLLHAGLAKVIGDDAANLAADYREYQRAEDQSTRVAEGITVNPATIRR